MPAEWLRRHPWLAAWLSFLPVAVLRAGTIAEDDTLWQTSTGLRELATRSLVRTDILTWTREGHPWIQNSWAYNLLDGLAYQVGGLGAVSLVGSLFVMLTAGAIILLARELGASPAATALIMLFGSPFWVIYLNARPHVVDYAATGACLLLVRRIGQGRRPAGAVGLIAVICVAWTNLHPAVPVAVAAIGAAAGAHLVRREWAAMWWTGAAGIAAALAGLVNPYGWEVYLQGSRIARISRGSIIEWSAPEWDKPGTMLVVALCVAGTVAMLRRREWALGAALFTLTAMSLVYMRFGGHALMLAIPALAVRYAPFLDRVWRRYRPVLLAGLAAYSAVAAVAMSHPGRLYEPSFPVALVDKIPANCLLLSQSDISGLVSLRRPDVRPAVDGRVEVHGIDGLYAIAYWTADEEPLKSWIPQAGCSLMKSSSNGAAWLAKQPDWQLLDRNDRWVLYVRKRG